MKAKLHGEMPWCVQCRCNVRSRSAFWGVISALPTFQGVMQSACSNTCGLTGACWGAQCALDECFDVEIVSLHLFVFRPRRQSDVECMMWLVSVIKHRVISTQRKPPKSVHTHTCIHAYIHELLNTCTHTSMHAYISTYIAWHCDT